MSTSIDANGYPIAFKVSEGGTAPPLALGRPGDMSLIAEVRHVGHHQKEAVIIEGNGGPVWRLASDEGAHLKGTDLAPFPLGFFNAGLQADFAGRIVQLAAARAIVVDGLQIDLTTAYSLTGSFIQGTGVGVAEGVSIDLDIASGASADDIAMLLRDAAQMSPALAMVTMPIENTFALYVNGRRHRPTTLPASEAGNPVDPFIKYADVPRPLRGGDVDLIVKRSEKQPGSPSPAPAAGRVIREVKGHGHFEGSERRYKARVGLNLPGSSIFDFTTDETARALAPTGLALAVAGIAFCYITQISRYIENMKLPIRGIRLVQTSPFGLSSDGQASASPCDTHLFLNGEASPDTFEMLQRASANTCYLHQTMRQTPPLTIRSRLNGHTL